jgi:hypothetical protein
VTERAAFDSGTPKLGDVDALREIVHQGPEKVDLEWTSEVCICTRKIVHAIVIAPVDRQLMLEAKELIQKAVDRITPAAKDSQEIRKRLDNIRQRQSVLERLGEGRALVPLSV